MTCILVQSKHKFVNKRCLGNYRLVTQRCPRPKILLRAGQDHTDLLSSLVQEWPSAVQDSTLVDSALSNTIYSRLNRLVAQIFPGHHKLVTWLVSRSDTDSWHSAVRGQHKQLTHRCPGQRILVTQRQPVVTVLSGTNTGLWLSAAIYNRAVCLSAVKDIKDLWLNNVQNIIDMGHILLDKFWRISLYSTEEWWRYCKV